MFALLGPYWTNPRRRAESVLVTARRSFLHVPADGVVVLQLTKGPDTPIPYLAELGKQTGRTIAAACMFHSATSPEASVKEMEMIDAAAADGVSIWGQVSPAPLNMEFQLLSPCTHPSSPSRPAP